MTTVSHPLALVTQEEIAIAAALIRADERFPDDAVFAHLRLREPHKDVTRPSTARSRPSSCRPATSWRTTWWCR
jgi:Cu2+-containing amine oxidase